MLQQECESGMAEEPQLPAICSQHSRSASVRVAEIMQAMTGDAHTESASASAASLQIHFTMNSLIALSTLPQFLATICGTCLRTLPEYLLLLPHSNLAWKL